MAQVKSKEEQAGQDLVGQRVPADFSDDGLPTDMQGVWRVEEIGVAEVANQQEGQRTIAIFFFIYILKQTNKTKGLVKGPFLSGFVRTENIVLNRSALVIIKLVLELDIILFHKRSFF